jgi:ankyrin repeat protein
MQMRKLGRSGWLASAAVLWLLIAGVTRGAGPSDIADAAQRGDRAAVAKLIQQKANVNAPQIDGATALHWAVYKHDAEMVDLLIRAGADVKAANRTGITPLTMAAIYGDPAIIDRLIKAGADAKQMGPNGETMVMFAARAGNPQGLKVLLEAGADVNARESIRGTTALMWAVEQKHSEAVKVLLAAGADPEAKSGGAGLPRNYMANRVNQRAVLLAQDRRRRAAANGITYEEQLTRDQKAGVEIGGQRGLGQALGADGQPLAPGGGGGARQGGAAQPGTAPATPAAATDAAPGATQGPAAQSSATTAPDAQAAAAGRGGRGGRAGRQGGQAQAQGQGQGQAPDPDDSDDNEVVVAGLVGSGGGGLTPLIFAAREGDIESAKALLDAGAKINAQSEYGWTALLTAVNNRNYKLAAMLLDRGADPNIANKGGWTPLYLATDNRNIEGGDYPVPKPDMDHLEIIAMLLDKGADPNARIKDNTLTRTIFTMQWFFEDGATAFVRASQSSDTALMRLLLKYKADPKIATTNGDTALTASAGIGWVEGVTYERSAKENFEAVKMLVDELGLDPNQGNNEGRTPLMGAAMKGRNDVVQFLVDRGAKLDTHDKGNRDTDKVSSAAAGHTWQAVDYAEGLVRVGVQSAVQRPETAALIRKLMQERGMKVPPADRTILSVCVVALCQGDGGPTGK